MVKKEGKNMALVRKNIVNKVMKELENFGDRGVIFAFESEDREGFHLATQGHNLFLCAVATDIKLNLINKLKEE